MKFNQDISTLHAYLCADGYVIKNPPSQKHKYYHIALRNTNDVLLKDFQKRFERTFGVRPHIVEGRCRIQSKEIYEKLTKDFSFYSYEWKLPIITKENMRHWLRAFYDCEGWVEVQPGKSRSVNTESVNIKGILDIRKVLKEKFRINSSLHKRKNRNTIILNICGKENIEKFRKEIGFLHPAKIEKLLSALASYKTYKWVIPKNKEELLKFSLERGKLRADRNEIRFLSILKTNVNELKRELSKYNINSKLYEPWKNSRKVEYHCLTIKQDELEKLKSE